MFIEVIRLIIMLVFTFIGSQVYSFFIPFIGSFYQGIWGRILIILLFTGVGFVLGGILGRKLTFLVSWLENLLSEVPSIDLIVGIVGLLIGLVIASIISFPFLITLEEHGRFYTFLSFFLFGSFGLFIALHKRKELKVILSPGEEDKLFNSSYLSEKILDTSAIIDGRIVDLCRTNFLEGRLNVPYFVLKELQSIADSKDSSKRNRGKRGLEVLEDLRSDPRIKLKVIEKDYSEIPDVDTKIVTLAKEIKAKIITTDFNLTKIAQLQGVKVLNLNDLSNALKPIALPGEELKLQVIREGKEDGQGVGYLDDGTMVVVEDGEKFIGKEIKVSVTGTIQTSAGRIIFTRPQEGAK